MVQQEYPGTLGLRNVEVGKAYFVTNGHWDFKVEGIHGDKVTFRFIDGRLSTTTIKQSETSDILYIEPSRVHISAWDIIEE